MTNRSVWLLFALAAAPAPAHELISTKLTWTEHVSRIFYRRCVSCHRDGGAAPMPLVTYQQARPWAKAIKVQILSRAMPPWGPAKGYGDFRDDPSLSQEEIAVISSWVEGGAPQGDLLHLDVGKIPREFPATAEPAAKEIPLEDGYRLGAPLRILGVRAAGAVEVRAKLPGGAVSPLVWMPRTEPRHPGAYWYREAVALPEGTEIRVFGNGDGKTSLLIEAR